jgi:hypothetical protein
LSALYNKSLHRNGGKRYYHAYRESPSGELQAVIRARKSWVSQTG